MKKTKKNAISIALLLTLGLFTISPTTTLAASTPSLGFASTYGVLSSTYTDTSAATTVNGSVGFTTPPATAIGGTHLNYGSGAPYATAGVDQGTALTALNTEACTFTFGAGPVDLSTDITHGAITEYTPGVYCSSGAMNISGALLLNGAGTYIFRTDGALTTTAGAVVSTAAGASACDAFWTPTQATTIGANTTFIGTVIDDAGITVGANTTWTGRALAFGGTVTTDTDTITVPTCGGAIPAILRIIKSVVNTGGGSLASSNFNLYVKDAGVNVAGSPAVGAGTPGTSYSLTAGTYVVSEDASSSYSGVFSGDCDSSGSITLLAGTDKTCTLTNTFIPPVQSGGAVGIQFLNQIVQAITQPIIATISQIGVSKTPSTTALLSGSGFVKYTYNTWITSGSQPLHTISLVDSHCPNVTFISGDTNNDNKLNVDEKWIHECTTTLYVTTTNVVTATGYNENPSSTKVTATDDATVTVSTPILPNTSTGTNGMNTWYLLGLAGIIMTVVGFFIVKKRTV